MKKIISAALMAVSILAGQAYATPLRLDYSVTPTSSNLYHYDFSLTLDNHDGSWVAGQSWNWIVFADAPYGSVSPLRDFVLESLSPGTGMHLSTTSGGHNGPTFITNKVYENGIYEKGWEPGSIGDKLTWSGTSTADLSEVPLSFSTLIGVLGGEYYSPNRADFEAAQYSPNREDSEPAYFEPEASTVPEPSTFALLGAGLLGALFLLPKRRTAEK